MKASITLLLSITASTFAKCNKSGWAWNGAANEVNNLIASLCNAEGLAGNFEPNTVKEKCLATTIASGLNTSVNLSIKFHGTAPMGMPDHLCVSYLQREVNGCYLGGSSRRNNDGVESDSGFWTFT
jgi:hypothetical protein